MPTIATKHIRSEFKHVSGISCNGSVYFRVTIGKVSKFGFKTEREAAIAVDKYLISKGKEPVNILIRKT